MGRFVETPDIRLHRVDHGGEGVPIVLVHGLGGSTADWDAVAPTLTRLGRVTAVDLPRFGFSPPTRTGGLDAMADALARFVDGVVGDAGTPAVLIGNSMGGVLSTLVAADQELR